MSSAGKTKHLYLISHEPFEKMDEIADLYGETTRVTTQQYDSYMSAAIDIELYGSGVIIYAITDLEHIKHILSFTEGIKKYIKTNKVRLIVIHSVEHPKLKKLLRKIGCSEIFKSSISIKFLEKLLVKYLGKATPKKDDDILFQSNTLEKKPNKEDQKQVIKERESNTPMFDDSPSKDESDEGVLAAFLKDSHPEVENKNFKESNDSSSSLEAIQAKVRNSKITGKEIEKPVAINFDIPDSDLDDEQKKIRSYYKEICPTDKTGEDASFGGVESDEHKSSFMNESRDNDKPVTIWTRGRENLIQADLQEIEPVESMYLVKFRNNEETNKLIKRIESGELDVLFIKLDISRGSIFFDLRDPKNKLHDRGIKVTIPERMWKVDRRAYHRLQFPKTVVKNATIILEGETQTIERRLLNISAGGASMAVDPSEIEKFQENSFIENFKVSIKENELDCCARVVWSTQYPGENFITVGVEFLGLDTDFIEVINLFILEETFDFWEKYHV